MEQRTTYITLNRLSARLGLPERWLRDEAHSGRLPYIQAGKRRLYNSADVERVLSERAMSGRLRAEVEGVSDGD